MNVLGRNCQYCGYNFCTVARVKMSVIEKKERKRKKILENTLITHSSKSRFRP